MVVLNKEEYTEKALQILADTVHFKKIEKNPTSSRARKLGVYLRKNIKPVIENDRLYSFLNPSGDPRTPQLYILIKIHKPEKKFPGRPIVSAVGAYNYNLGKYLVWALEPYLSGHDSYIKNSADFVNKIRNQSSEGKKQVSFDVESLYTMVPVVEAIECAMDHLSHDENNRLEPISCSCIEQLFRFCTTECNFQFQGTNYDQIEGLCMGNPLAPSLANLFMINIEKRALASGLFQPTVWFRYVDDIYCLIEEAEFDNLHNILEHLNSIHPSINFTVEKEGEKKSLSFLNVLCSANERGTYSTSVYRKPTNTNLYVRWESAHPPSQKIGVFRTLLHQAKVICSDEELLRKEYQFLFEVFKDNGYPVNMLRKSLDNFKNRAEQYVPKRKNEQRATVLSIPYVPGVSESIAKEWKKCSSFLNLSIPTKVVFRPTQKVRSLVCSLYDQEPMGRGVYRAICGDCDGKYIGETGNFLSTRMKQHQNCGAIRDHCRQMNHDFNSVDWKLIRKEPDPNLRRIYESMLITEEVHLGTNILNNAEGVQSFCAMY